MYICVVKLCTSFAGFPMTVAPSGTFLVTTDPAPTVACFPMMTPGRMTAPAPIDAPCFTTVFERANHMHL